MITLILIGITVAVSLLAMRRPPLLERLLLWPPAVAKDHQFDRLLTHGFVHAGNEHLLFNMITLFFFGRTMEPLFVQLIGSVGYALFYLSAIVIAILPTYLRHRKDANYRSLGASGAVSAVLFSYILVAPWSTIYVFIVPVPAILYAVFYVGWSIWMDRRGGGNINHSAHLWGALYGVLFTLNVEPRIGSIFLQRLLEPLR